ncbi:VanZ family protein [Actinokineospora terrae]|uniref:VanZ like family protein n=1 Tax=Actinokineospora terrae TaxID=155974 RepID=A0A1H9X857_9PSEU|nr:VanZ family protein [Actinokineospora terrae]SES42251.1 VanZ like family protein [Actinokineospora terrae]
MTSLTRAFVNPVSLGLALVIAVFGVTAWVLSLRDGRGRPGGAARALGWAAAAGWLLFVTYITVVLPSSSLGVRFSLVPLVDTVQGLVSPAAGNVLVATLGNIVLFVPLGAVVAVLAPRSRVWTPLWAGLVVSLLVELTQGFLAQKGAVAADDLISNTAGAVIGWWIVRGVDRVIVTRSTPRLPDLLAEARDHG